MYVCIYIYIYMYVCIYIVMRVYIQLLKKGKSQYTRNIEREPPK